MEEVNQEQIINECFSTNLDPQNLPDLNTTCTVTDIQEVQPNETEKKKTKKKTTHAFGSALLEAPAVLSTDRMFLNPKS